MRPGRAGLLLMSAAGAAASLREMPALSRLSPDAPYHIAALFDGEPHNLNKLFGTSFDLPNNPQPRNHQHTLTLDASTLANNQAVLLILANNGNQTANKCIPLPCLEMSELWLALLPEEGNRESYVDTLAPQVALAVQLINERSWEVESGPTTYSYRQLLLIDTSPRPSAQNDEVDMEVNIQQRQLAVAELASRLEQNINERISNKIVVRVKYAVMPGHDHAVESGSRILSRLFQPASEEYLLTSSHAFGKSGVRLTSVPCLLRSFATTAFSAWPSRNVNKFSNDFPVTSEGWMHAVRCAESAEKALTGAVSTADAILVDQASAVLNPLPDVAQRVEQMRLAALQIFNGAVGAIEEEDLQYVDRGTYESRMRSNLERELAAISLRITRAQLRSLRNDAINSFRSDIVEIMHCSRRPRAAFRRLSHKYARRFQSVVQAALPPSCHSLAAVPAARCAMREASILSELMQAEVADRIPEAESLPPHESDDSSLPTPWWKQILAQLLGMVLNAAQFYFLQHLPSRRADLREERLMPRAPLF